MELAGKEGEVGWEEKERMRRMKKMLAGCPDQSASLV
jgi:hypothetical protein